MKSNIKFYLFFCLILFCLFGNVYAAIDNDCLTKHTCFVACSYTNNVKVQVGSVQESMPYGITIYSYFDGDWEIKYDMIAKINGSSSVGTKAKSKASTIFSNKSINIYSDQDIAKSIQNFTCPKHAFLDLSKFSGDNELCFDDNNKYCSESASHKFGAKSFGKNSDVFVSDSLDEDYAKQLNKYYTDGVISDIDCVDIAKNPSIISNITSKYEKDITNNYLFKHPMPKYMANYFQNSILPSLQSKLQSQLKAKQSSCASELKKMVSNGTITQQQSDKAQSALNSADTSQMVDDSKNFINNISNPEKNQNFDKIENNCENILGNDKTNSNQPIYWINLALNIMKYAAIIALIVFSILDFIKAIVSQDSDSLKKAATTTVKRLGYTIIIFFLPILINYLLEVLGLSGTCGL
jgi:hypothetical protein